MNDPGSETFFGNGRETSGIELPDPQQISSDLVTAPVVPFYAPHKSTPQGQLHEHWYESKITGNWRHCIVYTAPPTYDAAASSAVRYPVLYLLHGAGEDETGWSRQGGARISSWTTRFEGTPSSFFCGKFTQGEGNDRRHGQRLCNLCGVGARLRAIHPRATCLRFMKSGIVAFRGGAGHRADAR